jgi:hypothetical protein
VLVVASEPSLFDGVGREKIGPGIRFGGLLPLLFYFQPPEIGSEIETVG